MVKVKTQKVKSVQEEFDTLVAKFKKEKSKEELEKMTSIKPTNRELTDFMAARYALRQLTKPTEEPKKKVEKKAEK